MSVAVLSPVTIAIEGLSVFAHHGIGQEERSLGQRFEFDVEIDVSDCAACRTDAASDTVQYEDVVALIVEVATNFRFQLLEALAEAVCAELIAEFPVEAVRLSAHKLAPSSIAHPVARATVRLERSRGHGS